MHIHLLDKLRTRLLANHDWQMDYLIDLETQNDLNWQLYLNIQELQAVGIHLKRSTYSSLSVRDIFFSTLLCFGFLWLPPIIVDDSTGPKFFNLITYEICPDFKNDYGVTSCISFLDSLIDDANDVKELRKAAILYNLLGSDQEVTQLFNEIGTDLVPNNKIYSDVRSRIQSITRTRWRAGYLKPFTTISATLGQSWLFLALYWHLLSVLYKLGTLSLSLNTLNSIMLPLFPNKRHMEVHHEFCTKVLNKILVLLEMKKICLAIEILFHAWWCWLSHLWSI